MNRIVRTASASLLGIFLACGEDPAGLVDAPRADAGKDHSVVAGETFVLDGRASRDLDGRIVRYRWEQVDGPAAFLSTPDRAQAEGTAPTTPGTLTFRLTVTDDDGLEDHDEVDLIVRATAFTVDAGPDRPARFGAAVALEATVDGASDPASVRFAWRQVAGPEIPLDGAHQARVSFLAPDLETELALEVTATDADGSQATDRVVVDVTDENRPPIAETTSDLYPITVGGTVELDGSPSFDPDGNLETFEWLQVSGPAGGRLPLIDDDEPIALVVQPMTSGDYRVELTVTDDRGASTSTTVTVRVN